MKGWGEVWREEVNGLYCFYDLLSFVTYICQKVKRYGNENNKGHTLTRWFGVGVEKIYMVDFFFLSIYVNSSGKIRKG